MHRSGFALLLSSAIAIPGCLSGDLEDGQDDAFTSADGKADGYGLSDAEVAGVLDLVNHATRTLLADDVGLSARVAKNITVHRAGADAKLGTSDDDTFDDLAELDAVPYVGKHVFSALVEYAKDHGYVHGGGGGNVCKTEHAGKTPSGASVKICDALYDQAPFLHVPVDESSGSKITTRGAILNGLGLTLYTADGRQLALVDASGNTYPISHGPSGFKAPENLFAVYEVVGTKTTITGGDAIKVTSLTPIEWVPGTVQDKLLLGTWEAKASGRVGENQFDETKPVTFRFTLASTTDNSAMWSHYGGGDGLIVAGAIDNFSKRVTASDGTCLASLASLGTGSPFYQAAQNRLTLWRHPNMHGLNDQVIVMDYPTSATNLSMNGMGWIGPFSIMGLVQTRGPAFADVKIRPHSTPNGHVVWNFAKVTSGGATCP
jgi:hypothetical protein